MEATTQTVGTAPVLAGREVERRALHLVLDDDGPAVFFLHGIAGVGKSALVTAFATEARRRGAIVLQLDAGAIEPTERGFLAALAEAIGSEVSDVGELVGRLRELGDRVVVVIDTYEVLRPLDPWLRTAFATSLPPGVRLIVAGRESPMSGWRAALGALFRSLSLGNLPPDDARELLRLDSISDEDASRILRLARGHPLSLRLAAAAIQEAPAADHQTTTIDVLVRELTELYLARLDPLTRRALEAASVVRRPTRSLLAAMLPEAAADDVMERVRALPFVTMASDGLVVHETVREVVAAFLRASDPDRSRRYRIAAWRQLRREVAAASPHELWRYTADLLYILENPIVREAFFPSTEHGYFVDAATAEDEPMLMALGRRQLSPASNVVLAAWWKAISSAFRMARDPSGALVGFYAVAQAGQVSRRLLDLDEVTRRQWEHLHRQRVPPGQRVLFYRFEVASDEVGDPSMIRAALVLDLKRMYMELRPELRRIYTCDVTPVTPASPWARLGFEPLPVTPVELDGVPFYLAVLDFGPASVDGWLSRVVATELQIEDDSLLDVVQRQLLIDGRRVHLTALEFEVMNYLHQRQGRVVHRRALLRDVWGYDDPGGSNVIEALVRSLRRKLGDRASVIQTVRGIGYRLTEGA
jgi:hypothetical protein